MKNSIFLSLLFIGVAVSSCHKPNGATSGGSWTFKSTTYTASFCSYILGGLCASTETSTPSGTLTFYFPDTIAMAGTYTIVNSYGNNLFIPAGHVYIQLTDTARTNIYIPTASATTTQVTVTISNDSIPTVSLPPIMMVNVQNQTLAPLQGYPSGTDSGLLTGKITQTLLN